jgi:hypothetical protein
MSDQAPDKPTKWAEIAAAIILSLASLLTAWSSFEATQWTRSQAANANAVIATLLDSSQEATLGGQDTLVDVVTFTSWLEAISTDNQPLADFYRGRFREEFKPAFEAWLAIGPLTNPDAPSSPFAMSEYAPARRQAAQDLQKEAAELQGKVRTASENAAYYVRNTLFLALALFLVGISRMFPSIKVRLAIQVLATGLLLLGIAYALTGPIA